MISSHSIKGIGADNFGFQLNGYRSAYGTRNPQDPNLAHAESEIPERAHNELLQIVAELGMVGGAIVGWLLLGIVLMAVRAFKLRLYSNWRLAAYFGLIIFLTSSLVSSYSFRLIQNGFVFFFLLAICSKYFLNERQQESQKRILLDTRAAAALGLAACLLLAAYSATRVSSVIAGRTGDNTKDTELAADYYQLAMKLDKENPSAPATLGMRLFFERRFSESAPWLENAIAIGKATSTDFSYLASAYTLGGDNRSAERTMARAVAMYPRSVFVLVRYGLLAQSNGDAEIAERALESARALDSRSANSWIELITNGPLQTSELAFKDKDSYAPVMDLRPEQAMYAVLDEREILQPEERRKVGF
jgi:Tfp pilus assembly protein PilF